MWGKRGRSWSRRERGGKRIGEEEQRSLLESGGEGGRSSKKDLLLPHTAADIVLQQRSHFQFQTIASRWPPIQSQRCGVRVWEEGALRESKGFS